MTDIEKLREQRREEELGEFYRVDMTDDEIDQAYANKYKSDLRNIVFKAWDATPGCPDGDNAGEFCPACFFENFYQLLTESKIND